VSGRLTDDQVAWYAGTSRTAKWTADMAVHENIVTLAREVQAHRSSCECAPLAEYPHEMWCPSIDVCAICADSECDGIGCISDLDPNDRDDQPHLEQLQAWVRLGRIQEPLDRIIRDRDEWNEHLANEASLLVMAVPRVLRGLYLRRVARLRRRATT
jgi:hypothetical protein